MARAESCHDAQNLMIQGMELAVLKSGMDRLMKEPLIASVMRRSVVTTTPSELLAATRALMDREGVHQLPVLENGALVGILSERDLRVHTGYLERTKVDAAMTWNPVTVSATQSARHAAHLLIEKSINALPVVDDGRLVGIVSRTDLLQLLERLLSDPQS